MLEVLEMELEMRQESAMAWGPLETIYMGGGTPSLLSPGQLDSLLQQIRLLYNLAPDVEVTLEANPDDLTMEYMEALVAVGVHRLSIGVQSFDEEMLHWMNRSHDAKQAHQCLQDAQKVGLRSINIDLIYGNPGQSAESWARDLEIALGYGLDHYSCYALTVEEKTVLGRRVSRGLEPQPVEENQSRHFDWLMNEMDRRGYEHYEISNFCQEGYRSRHNSGYWSGHKYLGIGPSAHGYDGVVRYWNVSQNAKYQSSIKQGVLPETREALTLRDRYLEWLMVSWRLKEGCSLGTLESEYSQWRDDFLAKADEMSSRSLIKQESDAYVLTKKGKHLADWVTREFFPED